MFQCPVCDYSHESLNSLRIHASKSHKLPSEELYLLVVGNGQKPTCKCGCGEHTKFKNLFDGYNDYLLGHAARVSNNWGHNEKALEKSQEKRREMWKNGEIKPWCKGLTKEDPKIKDMLERMNTPERARKISKALKGRPKSEEHRAKIRSNMQTFWSDETNRSKQSERQADCILNGMLTKATRVYGHYEGAKKSIGRDPYYRSNFELNAIKHFESNESVISYEIEPVRIDYDFDGRKRHYVMDFIVEWNDGSRTMIEIKPHCYTNYDRYRVNGAKFEAARNLASEMGYAFEVWTEKTHPFLSIVNTFLKETT
jgi:hypothetical protein